MPTYEYLCNSCKQTFDRFESITAKPNPVCVHCGKKSAQRQISGGAGFLFKGSGFYTTDYRSESYKSSAKGDSGSKSADSCSSCPAAGKCPAAKD